ncbi:Mitogen-activated protein kinase HOG1 [Diplonema papillatum]|nr:Mitogen-activated protein kinase HOG1 [Diplonema papillatum]
MAKYQSYAYGHDTMTLTLDYTVEHTLGRGAYGVVWKGIRNGTTEVAIKKCPIDTNNPEQLMRLVREIRVMRHFDHDGILKLQDIVRPPTTDIKEVYLVMDCMNTDLQNMLHPDPPEQVDVRFNVAALLRASSQATGEFDAFGLKYSKGNTLLEVQAGSLAAGSEAPNMIGRKLIRFSNLHVSGRNAAVQRTRKFVEGLQAQNASAEADGAAGEAIVTIPMHFEGKKPLLRFVNKQDFLYQLLQAMSHLHAQGVMHRDIKPQNILVNSQGDVKICDFGLAREEDGSDRTLYVETRWYRAPELIIGFKNYDTKVDIWSLGCVLYEMLDPDNEVLFPGQSSTTQLHLILDAIGKPTNQTLCELTTSEAVRENILNYSRNESPLQLEGFPLAADLLSHMLAFSPADRYSADECLAHKFFDDYRDEEDEMCIDSGPSGTDATMSASTRFPAVNASDGEGAMALLIDEIRVFHPDFGTDEPEPAAASPASVTSPEGQAGG